MTAREEDILTNQNYIKQGIVIDKLLQSMLVTKFDYNDLLVGDKVRRGSTCCSKIIKIDNNTIGRR
jgi:hypothetical protein